MKSLRPVMSFALIAISLISLVALTCSAIWGMSRNTLVNNGDWISSKMLMELAPMGSVHFLVERQALQRERLQLHAWHGFNEVHLNRVFRPGVIRARFELEPDAYVYFIFNRNQSGFDAIRFSRHPRFPSVLVRVNRHGRFESKRRLPDADPGEGWHRVELDFSSGELVAHLDRRRLDLPAVAPVAAQFIGFRAGRESSAIDDVYVEDADRSLVIQESFDNRDDRRGIATVVFMSLAALAGIAAAIGRISGTGHLLAFRTLAAMLVLVSVTFGYYCFDAYLWSGYYFYYAGFTPHGRSSPAILQKAEELRSRFFHTNIEEDEKERAARSMPTEPFIRLAITSWDLRATVSSKLIRYRDSREKNALKFVHSQDIGRLSAVDDQILRLVFVGTSQTFGEGAEIEGHRFVDRVHHRFADALGESVRLQTFNFAVKGSQSDRLWERYETEWVNVRPDVVAINLSYNDGNQLVESLRRFAGQNQRLGIRTVFIVEPAAWASREAAGYLEEKRDAMRRLAEELHLPLIDLSAHMQNPDIVDSGLFWWDTVHMTSLGHEIAATFVAEGLRPIVLSRSP